MKKLYVLRFALLAGLVIFGACKKDDPEPVNEQEKITRVTLTFTPQGGGATVVWSWQDPDGDGTGTFTTPALAASRTYSVSITMLNELANPDEDITEEVEEEAEEHQLFYVVTGANLTFAYNDEDDNDKPIGLLTTATTGAASTGTVRVILKHEGTKNTTIGTPSTDGEDDFNLVFNATIN
ncbi:MAG: hypothetical protein MUE85_04225 [Microscillaceae bacterium]|jgi:hypothetical protein|nr:hypothetical protein [Microscillaceae bacterium]